MSEITELMSLIEKTHKEAFKYQINKMFDGKNETSAIVKEGKSIDFFCGQDSMGHDLASEGLDQIINGGY